MENGVDTVQAEGPVGKIASEFSLPTNGPRLAGERELEKCDFVREFSERPFHQPFINSAGHSTRITARSCGLIPFGELGIRGTVENLDSSGLLGKIASDNLVQQVLADSLDADIK